MSTFDISVRRFMETAGAGRAIKEGILNPETKNMRPGYKESKFYKEALDELKKLDSGRRSTFIDRCMCAMRHRDQDGLAINPGTGKHYQSVNELVNGDDATLKLQDNLVKRAVFSHRKLLRIEIPEDLTKDMIYEPIPKFTMKDLIDYYTKSLGKEFPVNPGSVIGQFNHLLKSVSLDAILYAIDLSAGERVTSPFNLENKLEEAQDIIQGGSNRWV